MDIASARPEVLWVVILLAILSQYQADPTPPTGVGVTDMLAEHCRLRRIIYTINIKNCARKRLLSYACQGACQSYTQVAADRDAHMERYCSCCQETMQVARNVSVRCLDETNPRRVKKMITRLMLPTGCMCRPCSAGIGVEPLELAGIGDKRNLWTVV